MKHNIVFKFIAFLLCAVTLMGAVGSACGIFVMTELDLYDKTVEQVQSERLLSMGEEFAREAALRYASQTLGGTSEEMLDYRYGNWIDHYFEEGKYSYSILDEEGMELFRSGETADASVIHTYPVSGQYLHTVSVETETERENRLDAQYASYSANITIGEDAYLMDALPPEGAHIAYASFNDIYGNVIYDGYNDVNGVGFLHYSMDGQVVFFGSWQLDYDIPETTVAGVYFQDMDGNVVYEASYVDGIGIAYVDKEGRMRFVAGVPENVQVMPAETVPPVLESVSPAEIVPVYYVAFYNEKDEKIYRVRGNESIGFLSLDAQGHLVYRGFQQEENRLPEDLIINEVQFSGEEDTSLYNAYSTDNLGTVAYTENGQLIFTSLQSVTGFDPGAMSRSLPAAASETVAVETGETAETAQETEAAEETVEETIQETTQETIEETQSVETVESTDSAGETQSTEETLVPTEPAVTEVPTEPAATELPDVTEAPAEPPETQPQTKAAEEPVLINGKPLEEYDLETEYYYDEALGESVYVTYVRIPMPAYTVEMRLAPDALGMNAEYQLLMLLRSVGNYLLPALGICLLLFAICAVYLCCAAGRRPRSEEVRAAGLNCLPLDLYTGLAFLGIALAANIGVETALYRLEENLLFNCALAAAMAFCASLILVAYCFAIVAQAKTPGGYWWRNTLCMRFIMLFMHFAMWLEKFLSRACFPWLGRVVKWCWNLTCKLVLGFFRLWQRFADWFLRFARRFARRMHNLLNRFFSLLPVTWQWLIGGCVLIFISAVFVNDAVSPNVGLVAFFVCIGIVFYVAHSFGVLAESTRNMSKGDLDTKVEDKLLIGCFKDFAGDLNDLADVAVVAAQKQLKSERMKTELITNVSHDIKTPLTSIINYVDLMQKPHTPEDQEQYLEVLNRQSQRLKKLIEDLMEMSKASTGNMTVEITTVDAVESVNQALGEFSDKLAAAQLTPMFRHSESRAPIRADGKLVWRVLSNVLSNAVKYAMPGTRLYIDLMELEGKVVISLKNISREQLNMDAEELMERFVRGDDSRNTEGSGLGLNIAKSLMELQRGQLQLLVDGDLFKVTLIFPGA